MGIRFTLRYKEGDGHITCNGENIYAAGAKGGAHTLYTVLDPIDFGAVYKHLLADVHNTTKKFLHKILQKTELTRYL